MMLVDFCATRTALRAPFGLKGHNANDAEQTVRLPINSVGTQTDAVTDFRGQIQSRIR